ncbi:MAG: hypothetical protein Q8O92_10145 [Candidatus Latescibacter sp.]|nr:hypothetical protein [Candidatus Latescibacter sp.]
MLRNRLIIMTLMAGICLYSFADSSMSQEYYTKGEYRLVRSTYTGPLISGMNVFEWSAQNLPGFEVRPQNSRGPSARSYIIRSSDMFFEMYIGIHPTVRETEDTTLDYFNRSLTVFFNELEKPPFGDSGWFYGAPDNPDGIVFIRKNVLIGIDLNSSGRIDVLALAKTIDSAIINGAPYVKISDVIEPPVINSVSLSKNAVTLPTMGSGQSERVLITISAVDPQGFNLLYWADVAPFGYDGKTEKNNILSFNADTGTFPFDKEVYGEHRIKVWVANESNLFSRVTEVPITF